MQDSNGNEDNGCPVPDHNKIMVNDTKKSRDAHKNILKEKILQVIIDNIMKKILDSVNQNVQDAIKKVQDNKNKEYEETQKQINELIGALNKHKGERTL
jgi:mevalonate kinase